MERRPIPGFPGYEITEDGRVFSWLPAGGNHKPPTVARELKPIPNTQGYYQVNLRHNAKNFKKLVHRLVLETFVGPPKEGLEACHNNGCRTNNHLSNLRWDTSKSNALDKIAHGTEIMLRGVENINSKLTEKLVLQIRALHKTKNITHKELAQQFNVHKKTISQIVNGKTWTHIPV